MQFVFDGTSTVSHGYFECPECGSTFYGGGAAIHRQGCTQVGYAGTVYHYCKAEYDRWLEEVVERGYCANLPLSPNALSNYFLLNAINGRDALCKMDLAAVKEITERYVRSINADHLPGIMRNLEQLAATPI